MPRKLFVLAIGLVAILILPAQLSGGKPPKPGTANPELTFLEGSKIQVCNRDGSNKVTIYNNRDAYLRHPRMAPDHRSVVFWEAPLGQVARIRRTVFTVVSGNIVVGGTETLFAGDPGNDVALHPLQADGTRLALFVGNGLYELWMERDCPMAPCVLADLGPPLYQSAGYLYDPLGGYSANGRALYFQEGLNLQTGVPVDILRLEFPADSGDPILVSTVLADLPYNYLTLQASRIDYSAAPYSYEPFETRLLIDGESTEPYETGLRTFDTWDGTLADVLSTGHRASWSPDERSLIYVNRWQNAANWIRGRVITLDRESGVYLQIDDFSADPDWAPPLR